MHRREIQDTQPRQMRPFDVGGEPSVRVFRDCVHGESPIVLPTHRCVKCGSTERGGTVRREVLSYVNPFIWLTLLISGLITLIAYFFTRKQMEVQYYLCPRCADNRRIGRLTTGLVMFISIIGLIFTVTGGPFEMFAGAFFMALIARLFWAKSPLRPVSHDGGRFSLKGASREFLTSVERKQLER